MFEAILNENDNGKIGLAVRGHFAGEFDNEKGAFKELQELVSYELEKLKTETNDISTLDDWIEFVHDCKAFLVNGKVCSDFSFPSPDDDTDDNYSFYIYGANGIEMEVFISSSDVKNLKVVNLNEIICDVTKGTYTFQALS